MKRVLKTLGFAGLAVVMGAGMAHAAAAVNQNAICVLMEQMGGVFKMLRNLAFVGAAFVIAGWAWGYISSGKVELKDVKEKGVGMLVGFILLFGLGVVLQFLMSAADPAGGSLGCVGTAFN